MSEQTLCYSVKITPREDGGYSGEVPELGSCFAEGATPEECLVNLKDSLDLWLETAREAGLKIPEPGGEQYSGNFALRMPKSLHGELAEVAKEQGISLNQLINLFLSSHLTTFRITSEFAQGSRQLRDRFAELNWELRQMTTAGQLSEWGPSLARAFAERAQAA